MLIRLVRLCSALLVFAGFGQAALGGNTDLLAWYESKNKGLQTIRANVRQVRNLPYLKQPLVSEGTVSLDEHRMEWRIDRPEKTIYTVSSNTLTIRYEDVGSVRTVDLEKDPVLGSIFANFRQILSGKLEALETLFHFDSQPQKKILMLTPKNEMALPFKRLRILLDEEGQIRVIRFDGFQDEWTEIQFSNVRRTFRSP
ncbi:MAG: outer membrane lipoprotein carrier protein LolA [Deltaproteobacteria bacterium]|nr:outer membrane lipoprotein carrier protein LolA [Deltaproteobacteria bacterium]